MTKRTALAFCCAGLLSVPAFATEEPKAPACCAKKAATEKSAAEKPATKMRCTLTDKEVDKCCCEKRQAVLPPCQEDRREVLLRGGQGQGQRGLARTAIRDLILWGQARRKRGDFEPPWGLRPKVTLHRGSLPGASRPYHRLICVTVGAVKRRCAFGLLRNWDVDEITCSRVDGGIPFADGLVDADADEVGAHGWATSVYRLRIETPIPWGKPGDLRGGRRRPQE